MLQVVPILWKNLQGDATSRSADWYNNLDETEQIHKSFQSLQAYIVLTLMTLSLFFFSNNRRQLKPSILLSQQHNRDLQWLPYMASIACSLKPSCSSWLTFADAGCKYWAALLKKRRSIHNHQISTVAHVVRAGNRFMMHLLFFLHTREVKGGYFILFSISLSTRYRTGGLIQIFWHLTKYFVKTRSSSSANVNKVSRIVSKKIRAWKKLTSVHIWTTDRCFATTVADAGMYRRRRSSRKLPYYPSSLHSTHVCHVTF